MELFLYLIIGIIWLIFNLIQKAAKGKNNTGRKRTVQKAKPSYKRDTKIDNEEEIFRNLKKNINDLKKYNELENQLEKDEYFDEDDYSSNNEMLRLQEEYNSRIKEIESRKIEVGGDNVLEVNNLSNKRKHVNNMLSSLDIKNAIIYNAILEPKRINYRRINRQKREILK